MADKVANMAKIKVAIEKTASKSKKEAVFTHQASEVKKNTAASRYLNKKVKLHSSRKKQLSPRLVDETAEGGGKESK